MYNIHVNRTVIHRSITPDKYIFHFYPPFPVGRNKMWPKIFNLKSVFSPYFFLEGKIYFRKKIRKKMDFLIFPTHLSPSVELIILKSNLRLIFNLCWKIFQKSFHIFLWVSPSSAGTRFNFKAEREYFILGWLPLKTADFIKTL